QVHHYDDAQVYWIDTEFHGDRKQDRRQYQDDAGRFHECAGDQQQDVDDDQEFPRGHIPRDDLFGDHLRNALGGQHVREQQRIGNDEHQHYRDLGGVDQYIRDLAQANVAVHVDRDDECVNRSHGGRFGGGENAAVDAAQDY